MTTNHTPGPWKPIRDLSSKMLEIWADDGDRWIGEVQRKEDARLIAAAPDLLAACDSALGYLVMIGTDHGDGIRAVLRAAIAKAKGETT